MRNRMSGVRVGAFRTERPPLRHRLVEGGPVGGAQGHVREGDGGAGEPEEERSRIDFAGAGFHVNHFTETNTVA